MLGESQCFDLVNAALTACEADQAEVMLQSSNSALTRFAESRIHQNVSEMNATLSVRAVLGKRIGCPRANQLTADEARATPRRALDLARASAENVEFASLPGPQSIPSVDSFAAATAASTPEERAAAARVIAGIAGRSGCMASGSISAEAVELAIANSLGVQAYTPLTQASLVLVVSDEGSTGYAEWRGMDLAQMDAQAVARTATQKCVDGHAARRRAHRESTR